MHDMLTEKLLLLERILLGHEYQELLLRTQAPQLHEKAQRLLRIEEEQIRLLEDLLREMEAFDLQGDPLASEDGSPPR